MSFLSKAILLGTILNFLFYENPHTYIARMWCEVSLYWCCTHALNCFSLFFPGGYCSHGREICDVIVMSLLNPLLCYLLAFGPPFKGSCPPPTFSFWELSYWLPLGFLSNLRASFQDSEGKIAFGECPAILILNIIEDRTCPPILWGQV